MRPQTRLSALFYSIIIVIIISSCLECFSENGDLRSVLESLLDLLGANGADSVRVLARNGDTPLPAALHVSELGPCGRTGGCTCAALAPDAFSCRAILSRACVCVMVE